MTKGTPFFIEVRGTQFVNKGAELMLLAIIDQAALLWPEAKFVLKPSKNSPYDSRAKVGAYQKLDIKSDVASFFFKKAIRHKLISKYGVVTDKDISLVLDASGFAYGDQWGLGEIKGLSKAINRAAKFGSPYILLPQAFGPFRDKESVEILRDCLPKASMVFAREETSERALLELETTADIRQFPDFTNLLAGKCPEYFPREKKNVVLVPNANMISQRNSNKAWMDVYVDSFVMMSEVLKKQGYSPIVLNHEGRADSKICKQIALEAGGLEIIEESNAVFVKGIIGASAAVISSRFHACVSALCQGIPCLGTSWSHKYERLFESYGREQFIVQPTLTKDEFGHLFADCVDKTSPTFSRYIDRIEVEKSKARLMWESLKVCVDKLNRN